MEKDEEMSSVSDVDNDPYPEDEYPTISKSELNIIDNIIQDSMHYPLDKVTGYISREVYKGFKDQMKIALSNLKLEIGDDYRQLMCVKCPICGESAEYGYQVRRRVVCIKCKIDDFFFDFLRKPKRTNRGPIQRE